MDSLIAPRLARVALALTALAGCSGRIGPLPPEPETRPPMLPVPLAPPAEDLARVPEAGTIACDEPVVSLGGSSTPVARRASNAVVDPAGRLYFANTFHGAGTSLYGADFAKKDVWTSIADAVALEWVEDRLIAATYGDTTNAYEISAEGPDLRAFDSTGREMWRARLKDLLPVGSVPSPEPRRVPGLGGLVVGEDGVARVFVDARQDRSLTTGCWTVAVASQTGDPVGTSEAACEGRAEDGAGNAYWIARTPDWKYTLHIQPHGADSPVAEIGPFEGLLVLATVPGTAIVGRWDSESPVGGSLHFVSLVTGAVYAELPIHAGRVLVDAARLWFVGGDSSGPAVFIADRRTQAPLRRLPLLGGRNHSNLVLTDRGTGILVAGRDWEGGDDGRLIEVRPDAQIARQCRISVPNPGQLIAGNERLFLFGESLGGEQWIGAFDAPGVHPAAPIP